MATKKVTESPELVVNKLDVEQVTLHLLGTTPFIFNRVSEKSKHELLMPRSTGKLTTSEKASKLKHDVRTEFLSSMYMHRDDNSPTRLRFPSTAPKKAMSTAALDLPGLKKAQIGRLVWIQGTSIDIYGVPQLFMSVVRSADIAKTPDIRTRAILPQWACQITISCVRPILSAIAMANLLAASGLICGLGDWRQEKGSGNHGQFQIVEQDDPQYLAIIQNQGRVAQDIAIKSPATFDDETDEMITWYDTEIKRRNIKVA